MKKYLIAIAIILLASTSYAGPAFVGGPGPWVSPDNTLSHYAGSGTYGTITLGGASQTTAALTVSKANGYRFRWLQPNTTKPTITGYTGDYWYDNGATLTWFIVSNGVETGLVFPAHATITFPSATGTLITATGTETLTNKTLTAPNIQSQENVISTDTTLTAAMLYQGRFNNYSMSASSTATLPTAGYGMDAVFIIATTTATWTINSAASNEIYTAGGGVATYGIKASSPSIGDYFTFFSFKTGTNTWKWIFASGRGTQASY